MPPPKSHLILWAGWQLTGPMNHVAVGDGLDVLEVVPLYDTAVIGHRQYLASKRGLRYIAQIPTPREVDIQAGSRSWSCVAASVRVMRAAGLNVPRCITPQSLALWCMTYGTIRPVTIDDMEEPQA
jgi:hypothetical protein